MAALDQWHDMDVVPPKEPISILIDLNPEEVELAFATNANSLRQKVLMALVVAMINDRTIT